MPPMKGLDGVLILDFSKLLPGPFCSMVLADLGCRVIRIELPHWKDAAAEMSPRIDGLGALYWMINRNKESLSLDYRKPEGLKALERLLSKADVLLEGARPGLMDRLGLGYRAISRRHPRLIYCSLSGYGQDGPLRREAGHDLNYLAQSGLLGSGDSNGTFSFPPVQIADLSGSLYGATAVLAALLERAKSGRGQHIDISLAECAFSWMVFPAGYAIADREAGLRSRWWNGSNPFYRLYRTKDGRWLAVSALERSFAFNLLSQLGREDLAEGLPAFMDDAPRSTHRALEKEFAKKTLSQWVRRLQGKDVCVSPVLGVREAMRHPFLSTRGSLVRSSRSSVPAIRSPMRFSRAPIRMRGRPPAPGADTMRILSEFGLKKRRA